MTSLMTVKLGGLDFEKLEEQDIKSFVHKHEQDVPLLLQITNGCHGEANHLQTDSYLVVFAVKSHLRVLMSSSRKNQIVNFPLGYPERFNLLTDDAIKTDSVSLRYVIEHWQRVCTDVVVEVEDDNQVELYNVLNGNVWKENLGRMEIEDTYKGDCLVTQPVSLMEKSKGNLRMVKDGSVIFIPSYLNMTVSVLKPVSKAGKSSLNTWIKKLGLSASSNVKSLDASESRVLLVPDGVTAGDYELLRPTNNTTESMSSTTAIDTQGRFSAEYIDMSETHVSPTRYMNINTAEAMSQSYPPSQHLEKDSINHTYMNDLVDSVPSMPAPPPPPRGSPATLPRHNWNHTDDYIKAQNGCCRKKAPATKSENHAIKNEKTPQSHSTQVDVDGVIDHTTGSLGLVAKLRSQLTESSTAKRPANLTHFSMQSPPDSATKVTAVIQVPKIKPSSSSVACNSSQKTNSKDACVVGAFTSPNNMKPKSHLPYVNGSITTDSVQRQPDTLIVKRFGDKITNGGRFVDQHKCDDKPGVRGCINIIEIHKHKVNNMSDIQNKSMPSDSPQKSSQFAELLSTFNSTASSSSNTPTKVKSKTKKENELAEMFKLIRGVSVSQEHPDKKTSS